VLENSYFGVRAMKNWTLDTRPDLGQKKPYSREEAGGTSMPPATRYEG